MTDLSPAADAVLDAYTDAPVSGRIALAAALRAAADQIEDLYVESDVEDSDGIVFAMRQLVLIADELEGTT